MEKIAASIARIAAESAEKLAVGSQGVTVGLPSEVMAGLKAWIADQPEPRPTLSQAVEQGLAEWLRARAYLPAACGRPPGA